MNWPVTLDAVSKPLGWPGLDRSEAPEAAIPGLAPAPATRNGPVLKLFLILLLLLTTTATASERGERERKFVRSLELFDAATSPDEYRESAKVLESILADGFRSGILFYNLGNAYYRAGDYGRAILNYRKAMPYRPRDPYLAANLEQALTAAPGRLPDLPHPWWRHVLFWTDWLSYPRKVQCVGVGLSLAAVVWALAFLLRRPRLQLLNAGLVVVCLAIGIDAATGYNDVVGSRRAVITRETIARKGTGASYEAAFDQPLRDGAEFTVLGETSDWTFGRFENIGDGWVRNDCVGR